jgi:hypothetical protein
MCRIVLLRRFDIASRTDCSLRLTAPASIELSQVVNGIMRQLFRCDCTCESDGESNLFEVVRAIRACAQVAFEPKPLSARKASFQVIGQKLNGLLADEVSIAQGEHGLCLLHFSRERLA